MELAIGFFKAPLGIEHIGSASAQVLTELLDLKIWAFGRQHLDIVIRIEVDLTHDDVDVTDTLLDLAALSQ